MTLDLLCHELENINWNSVSNWHKVYNQFIDLFKDTDEVCHLAKIKKFHKIEQKPWMTRTKNCNLKEK